MTCNCFLALIVVPIMLNYFAMDFSFVLLALDRRRRTKLRIRTGCIMTALVLVLTVPICRAADDSNTGDFGNPPNTSISYQGTPPLNSTNLATGLDKLNQAPRNPDVEKLANALRNQNSTEAQTALRNIQKQLDDPGSTASQQLPTSLKDVLKSTKCTDSGCNVDWSQLDRMIQPYNTDSTGVPEGLSGENPASVADQLRTLAGMAASADPNLAQAMSVDVSQIMKYLNGSSSDYSGPLPNLKPPNLIIPDTSGTNGQSAGGAGIGPGAPSIGALPGIGTSAGLVLVPIIAILAGFLAYVFLRKKTLLEGPGIAPDLKSLGPGDFTIASLDPQDPRHSIILSFRRVVTLMFGRGIAKLNFETHREFSTKCEVTPERPYVGRIASLYERAMFSGRSVTGVHAEDARRQVKLIEGCKPETGKG